MVGGAGGGGDRGAWMLVCVYLMHLARKGQWQPFAMANVWLEARGVSRKTKYRILSQLEEAV